MRLREKETKKEHTLFVVDASRRYRDAFCFVFGASRLLRFEFALFVVHNRLILCFDCVDYVEHPCSCAHVSVSDSSSEDVSVS